MSEVENPAKVPAVYEAIRSITEKLSEIGIPKNQRNKDQDYKFRGIDDVYNVLSALLAKNCLVIFPKVLSRVETPRQTSRGSIMFNVCVNVQYKIVSSVDGSFELSETFGEASDMADKATNKALSAAYKYMAFQLFCIPVDAVDADSETPPETVDPNRAQQAKAQQQKPQGSYQGKQQQGSKPASSSKPKESTRSSMMTEDEISKIDYQISVATSDCDDFKLHEIAGMLGVERKWIEPENLKQLVVKCLGGRANIVTKPHLGSFEDLASRFVKIGVITEGERKAFCNSARSVLNLDLLK